ncbi:hypothetical protein J3F84DRAFT_381450, partial [Trichoderma pleuroticola]
MPLPPSSLLRRDDGAPSEWLAPGVFSTLVSAHLLTLHLFPISPHNFMRLKGWQENKTGEWRETKIKKKRRFMRGVSPVASSVFRSAGLKRGCMMPAAHLRHGGYRNRTTSEDLRRLRVCSFRFVFFCSRVVFLAVCVLVLCLRVWV